MTPPARAQAAIEVLDRVLRGASAEQALTAWGRASRYAGSGDRAAVRDHVFDALRRLRSSAWAGGAGDVAPETMDARAVMAGLFSGQGVDPSSLFTGGPHAPVPFARFPAPGTMPAAVALDVPDWLRARVGGALDEAFRAQRDRAPTYLRANPARASRDAVLGALAAAGFAAEPDGTAPQAIRLEPGSRGLIGLEAFRDGWFEMQDAGSQALVEALPIKPGARILDLCAGGGGKALAMAARGAGPILAHDADPARMRDLPARAARAGVRIALVARPEAESPFDGVVADVPCSGSGAWRRAPEARWRLGPDGLDALGRTQAAILARAAALVRSGGWVAYMTCSILPEENAARVDAACDGLGLELVSRRDTRPTPGGPDGFHLSLLQRRATRPFP